MRASRGSGLPRSRLESGMKRVAWMMALTLVGGCSSRSTPAAGVDGGSADEVQILSLSSFLGQLDPYASFDDAGVEHDFGGLAVLSSYFAADRASHPNTILLV